MSWRNLWLTLLCLIGTMPGVAEVSLRSLTPLSVRVLNPAWQKMAPTAVELGEPGKGLALRSESDVVYAIPPGQTSFSASLQFASSTKREPPAPDGDTRIRVRLYADERLVLDVVLERAQPPLRFVVTVSGASRLTIRSRDFFPPATFYLTDATFGRKSQEAAHYVPAAGEAYVGFHEVAATLLRKLEPSTLVPLDIAVAGPATGAELSVAMANEAGELLASSKIHVTLRPGDGIALGTALWQVPKQRGPLRLRWQLRVDGRLMGQRQLLVAVEPQLDLVAVLDTELGVGVSNQGYAKAADEFAYLWNAKWARIFVCWNVMQSQPGVLDFSSLDEVMADYRRQHMKILLVLGGRIPVWGDRHDQLRNFAQQVVRRYAGQVDAWEAYNELDGGFNWEAHFAQQPEWDLQVLQTVVDVLRQEDGRTPIVCCSSATPERLGYEERLLVHGSLKNVDILALHPYQKWNPEQRQGPYDLVSLGQGLQKLAAAWGERKPLWFTEAEWIMGAKGAPWVTAPYIDDEQQARYLQRATLLSMPVAEKYVVHEPFLYSSHRNEHIAALAAEAALMDLLADARAARFLLTGPQLYGVVAQTPRGLAGALWSVAGPAEVTLTGLHKLQFLDMYGNPLPQQSRVRLSESPTLFTAASGQARVVVRQPPAERQFVALPPWSRWTRQPAIGFLPSGKSLAVHTAPVHWNVALVSPKIAVQPHACYVIRVPMQLLSGAALLQVNDAATGQRLDYDSFDFPFAAQSVTPEIRFMTEDASQVELLLGAANNVQLQKTNFTLQGTAAIAACTN